MEPPLIVDKNDSKWKLLSRVLKIFDSRAARQVIAREGIRTDAGAVAILKIVTAAMFFSLNISYVVNEAKRRRRLRNFLGIKKVPEASKVYRFTSRYGPEQFIEMTVKLLNLLCKKRGDGAETIIADCTDITIDLNWFKKKIRKADLEDRDFKWGYSPSKGYYIGMKLVLAMSYPELKPLGFLIYQGSPHDTKIFDDIVEDLLRRRVLRRGDILVLDKGFFDYHHYVEGISRYGIVPLIFPKKGFDLDRLLGMISYPLELFTLKPGQIKEKKRFYEGLVSRLKDLMQSWEDFKPVRSLIEDVFKVAKNSFSMRKMHRYTMRSVKKACSLVVLLVGMVISLGFSEKEALQRLAEW